MKALSAAAILLVGLSTPLALSASDAPSLDADSVQALRDSLRHTLARWAEQHGVDDAQAMNLELEDPGTRQVQFGVLVDTRFSAQVEMDGLLVLGVTPGGIAEQIGVQAGDRLRVLDQLAMHSLGASVEHPELANAALALRDHLETLRDGDKIAVEILRGSDTLELTGLVREQHVPAFRLQLGSALGAVERPLDGTLAALGTAAASGCGEITTFMTPPVARDLHPARVVKINDTSRGVLMRDTFNLPPGKYRLEVHEFISDPRLRVRSMNRRSAMPLEFELQAGEAIYLAARFNIEHRFDIVNNDYWEPVIWKTVPGQCRGRMFELDGR